MIVNNYRKIHKIYKKNKIIIAIYIQILWKICIKIILNQLKSGKIIKLQNHKILIFNFLYKKTTKYKAAKKRVLLIYKIIKNKKINIQIFPGQNLEELLQILWPYLTIL